MHGYRVINPERINFHSVLSVCSLRFLTKVSVVEKADSSSVLPCPVSISTKNKMNFLFANLKDRDFLVQRISDFLQRTPDRMWSDANPPGPLVGQHFA